MFRHDDSLTFPKLRQVNLAEGRVYQVFGTEIAYPSITRVLGAKPKPQLEAWKKKVGHQKAQAEAQFAARKGTTLHKLAELYLDNQELPPVLPHVAELWMNLRPWLGHHVTCVYAQEQDICSHMLKVAGRLDLLADVDGELAVVDIKNAKRIKKREWVRSYFVQGTFYSLAVFEAVGRVVKKIVLPICSPEGFQVEVAKPAEFFNELRADIDYYYSLAS